MKRVITLAFLLLGICVGYYVAPFASLLFIESTDRDMFGAWAFSVVDSSIACSCENQPPGESLGIIANGLSTLKRWRDRNPNSRLLAQEIGLTEVRLARVEQKMGHGAEATAQMEKGQAELTALGWKDISAGHLIALTKQLDSDDRQADKENNVVAATR